MLPHAAKSVVSAETAANRATNRALSDLIICIPDYVPAAPVLQPSVKLKAEQ